MNIAYIRPYRGEKELVEKLVSGLSIVYANSLDEIDQSIKETIEIMSVFVDHPVTEEIMKALPNLRFIATRSTGYDHIDMEAATKRDIVVSSVPHYGVRTVAEYTFALLFALSRNAFRSYTDLQRDVSLSRLEVYEGFNLYGKKLGVVGTGAIGKRVCEIARGIGMEVIACDLTPDEQLVKRLDVTYAPLEELLASADVVSLHVPSTPATHHLIDQAHLALMKTGAYLINTARGEIVNTKALVEALENGHLAGAGLDVLEGEHAMREEAELLSADGTDEAIWSTLVANHALIDMPNVIVTPHIAFNTVEAKQEITSVTVDNIKAFKAGEPQNIVSS